MKDAIKKPTEIARCGARADGGVALLEGGLDDLDHVGHRAELVLLQPIELVEAPPRPGARGPGWSDGGGS